MVECFFLPARSILSTSAGARLELRNWTCEGLNAPHVVYHTERDKNPDEISARAIIPAKYKISCLLGPANIGSRPYIPRRCHVKLDRQPTDRKIANKSCKEGKPIGFDAEHRHFAFQAQALLRGYPLLRNTFIYEITLLRHSRLVSELHFDISNKKKQIGENGKQQIKENAREMNGIQQWESATICRGMRHAR